MPAPGSSGISRGRARSPRGRRRRRRGAPSSVAGSEHHEQALVVAHLRAFHPEVLAYAVPNGARRTRWERAQAKAEGMEPGVPDLVVDEARGGYFGLRIEMKRPASPGRRAGRESAAQKRVRLRLEDAGYRAVVCVGADAALRELETYLALPPTRVARRGRAEPPDPLS